MSSHLDTLKFICNKIPKSRTSEELDFLLTLTKNNKVFVSLSATKGPSLHRTCCKYLNYEFCESNSYLFEYGSQGNKFYIIYSGTVGIEIPKRGPEKAFEEILQLTEGGCFGELALESDKPRQASIKCKTDCHFIYLHKKDYQECLGNFIRDKKNQMVEFLSGLPLFQDFTKGTLAKISYILKEKSMKKGQTVYKEGDFSEEIFFILKGETGFYKKLKGSSEKGKIGAGVKVYEVNVANKAKGEMFGEEELVLNCNRTTSCRISSENCELFTASKSEFFKSVKNDEFWRMLRVRVLNQQEQIEKRLNFLIELKGAKAVYPMIKREKVEDVAEGRKLLRKSMTNLNSLIDRAQNTQIDLPYKTPEIQFKRSSTILSNFPAHIREKTRRTEAVPGLILNLPPLSDNQEQIPISRSRSSLGSKGMNSGRLILSVTEVSEEYNERKDLLEMPKIKIHTARSSSYMGHSSSIPTAQNLETVQCISHDTKSRYELFTPRYKKELAITPKHSSPSNSKFHRKRIGVSVYPMNSFPVYLALWSPQLKFL